MATETKKQDVKKSKKQAASKPAKSVVAKDKSEKKEDVRKEVRARARFIRIAPRKVRLVIANLSGLEAEAALDSLRFVKKAASRPVAKLINSAVANAENNFQLDKKDLFIKSITANDGPILKRYKPRAHGRSTAILKRTSHIDLILGVRPGAKKKQLPKKEAEKVSAKPEKAKVVSPDEVKKQGPKTPSKGPDEKGKDSKGFLRGFFQRKTG